ncbi:hypothetical protein ACTWP5_27485 [Streptomyces sp. 4N509B]|uniref:hypothetical protein n=1 Tax=Streptomyces sp. 4N509B TaxID=3457413 RepID=UPI003FD2FF82
MIDEWTLAYEMAGSTDAAWVIRDPATDGEPGTIIEVNTDLDPDADDQAQAWATDYLRQFQPVTGWTPHIPGPGSQPDCYIAVMEGN